MQKEASENSKHEGEGNEGQGSKNGEANKALDSVADNKSGGDDSDTAADNKGEDSSAETAEEADVPAVDPFLAWASVRERCKALGLAVYVFSFSHCLC